MGLFDRIFGIEKEATPREAGGHESGTRPAAPRSPGVPAEAMTDARALERYRYMVKTAPPEAIEEAHAEAFARLTPDQRRRVLAELASAAPPDERAAIAATSPNDPRAMGRLATRTEMRQPGFMERTFASPMGMGGSLLGSFAMGFLGSMVAQSFFSSLGGFEGFGGVEPEQGVDPEHGAVDEQRHEFDPDPTDPDMETEVADEDIGFDDGDIGGGDFDV